MTEIETIYKLIENVDKDDTATLDEIDMKVVEYLGLDKFHCTIELNGKQVADAGFMFCTSIDAQEQIDTEGWQYNINAIDDRVYVTMNWWETGNTVQIDTPKLPTEPLARLHAALKVVEYKRGRK